MVYSTISSSVKICLLSISIILTGCKDEKNPAGPEIDKSVTGTWSVSYWSWESQGQTGSYNKTQLDSIGIIWVLEFEEDASVTQTTNISGPLIAMPGTWETSGNQLSMTLTVPSGGEGTMVYEYALIDNKLNLSWQNESGVHHAEFSQ